MYTALCALLIAVLGLSACVNLDVGGWGSPRPLQEATVLGERGPKLAMIDISGLEMLYRLNENLHRMGMTLHLSEVKGPVMQQLEATDFVLSLHGSVFFTTDQAMRDLSQRL